MKSSPESIILEGGQFRYPECENRCTFPLQASPRDVNATDVAADLAGRSKAARYDRARRRRRDEIHRVTRLRTAQPAEGCSQTAGAWPQAPLARRCLLAKNVKVLSRSLSPWPGYRASRRRSRWRDPVAGQQNGRSGKCAALAARRSGLFTRNDPLDRHAYCAGGGRADELCREDQSALCSKSLIRQRTNTGEKEWVGVVVRRIAPKESPARIDGR